MAKGSKFRENFGSYKEKYPFTFGDQSGAEAKDLSERRDRAWELARRAAGLLKRSFGAERVVAFGSLVDPDRFTVWSDVDLAGWGIPPERYFAAVAAVTGLSPEFKVDLVDPNICRPSLRRAIEAEGVEL